MGRVPRDGAAMNRTDAEIDALLRLLPADPHGDDGVLRAYSSGVLPEAEAAALEAHLAACEHCRGLVESLAMPVPEATLAWAEARVVAPVRVRRRVWAFGGVAGALALAALLLVVLRPFAGREAAPSLPDFEVAALRGGVQSVRGDAPALTRTFLPQSTLRLDVRPVRALPRGISLAARAFAVGPDGTLSALPPDALVSGEGGALRVEGRIEVLFGASPGPRTVVVAVAADAGLLAGLEGASEGAARRTSSDIRWVSVPLEVRSGESE